MLTLSILLLLAAFVCTIASALSPPKCPLWIAVLLLVVLEAVQVLPK